MQILLSVEASICLPGHFSLEEVQILKMSFLKRVHQHFFSLFQHIYVVCSTIFWILVPDLQDEKPLVVSLK